MKNFLLNRSTIFIVVVYTAAMAGFGNSLGKVGRIIIGLDGAPTLGMFIGGVVGFGLGLYIEIRHHHQHPE